MEIFRIQKSVMESTSAEMEATASIMELIDECSGIEYHGAFVNSEIHYLVVMDIEMLLKFEKHSQYWKRISTENAEIFTAETRCGRWTITFPINEKKFEAIAENLLFQDWVEL